MRNDYKEKRKARIVKFRAMRKLKSGNYFDEQKKQLFWKKKLCKRLRQILLTMECLDDDGVGDMYIAYFLEIPRYHVIQCLGILLSAGVVYKTSDCRYHISKFEREPSYPFFELICQQYKMGSK